MRTNLKTNALTKLAGIGQSPWYDNIDRRFIKNGELKNFFENGILGVTSTKNPEYSDVKYVEEIIGPHTINTMPPETINAFLDHGKVELTIEKEFDKAKSDLARLKALGIDLDETCQEIQDAGVKAFQDSFDTLIRSINQKK